MNPKQLFIITTALLATLVAFVASLAMHAPSVQASAAAQEPAGVHVLYLPVVVRSPAIIYGRVTEGGAAAGGVAVSLRFYNGASWSTKATTQTDGTGRFEFVNQPPLENAQRYQVTFDNAAGNDNRLAWWGTRHLTSYTAGVNTHIGDFDIAAVQLSEPAHQATVGLPGTFRWSRRGATGSDSYALRVYDTADLNPLYVSPYVGYADSFTLGSLPGGFQHATPYTWDVILLAPDGATGVSRAARSVRFNGGLFGRVLQNGGAAGGVPLQLRFFNGSSWSTIASTTTAGDGTYAFTNAHSLGQGQKYYVRYENVTQTAGRLFLWSTRALTTYAAGTAVDLGSFDIADVTLVNPPGGAHINPPVLFQWTRRSATPSDGYILEIYDPSDYQPRWLSPLLGYADSYSVYGVPPGFSTNTPYAWDLIISSPNGGSGVSRVARLVQFASYTVEMRIDSAPWPFEEELPPRPAEDIEGVAPLIVGKDGLGEDSSGGAGDDGADTSHGDGDNDDIKDGSIEENSEGSNGAAANTDVIVKLGRASGAADLLVAEGQTDVGGSAQLTFAMPAKWADGKAVVDRNLVLSAATADGKLSHSASIVYIR